MEMTPTRAAYLEAAASAVSLLDDPAVAAAWDRPSALPEFSVRGLAGHLARQVVRVPELLAAPWPDDPPRSLLAHYTGSSWTDGDLDDETNVRVRRQGEEEAVEGAAALAARCRAVVAELRAAVPAEPADRVVHLPWGPWALTLDDFLTTRLVEIAVHSDDLAVSVGVATPALPPEVLDPVLALLSRLAVRRYGATALLRALSRAERAPATIAVL